MKYWVTLLGGSWHI